MKLHQIWQLACHRWQRSLLMGAGVALIVGVLGLLSAGLPITASNVNVLANGNFEDGFTPIPGCGHVGKGWSCFTNGGAVNYGFYDDQWGPVVANGAHSQLIEINTKGRFENDSDRVAGIYQTVPVVPHASYTLALQGMIRSTERDGDPWRYRVEVGWVPGVSTDWHQVLNWYDVGWDTYYPRTEPGGFSRIQHGHQCSQRQGDRLCTRAQKVGRARDGIGRQPGCHQPDRAFAVCTATAAHIHSDDDAVGNASCHRISSHCGCPHANCQRELWRCEFGHQWQL